MKLIFKRTSLWIITFFSIFLFNCAGHHAHNESWLETKDLFNVKIDMSSAEVIQQLGEPLFFELLNDIDEEVVTTLYYYNFRTKEYNNEILEESKTSIVNANNSWGRKTNVQFTFLNDKLIGWEEDNLTLSMAMTEEPDNSILPYLSLLLNLILILKVF